MPFVLVALLLLAVATVWAAAGGWGGRIAAPALAGVVALFVAYFFRDPKRISPDDDALVVSPADGKVLGVHPVGAPTNAAPTTPDLGRKPGDAAPAAPADPPRPAKRIAIFLSIFDVHVQRAPLAGRVRWRDYHKGSYKAAWREDAGERNERASLGVLTERGPVVVRQIAGLAARRIVTYPRKGDRVAKGERIGLIRFGSRVELDVPEDWTVSVQPGDRVRAGETVVAKAPPAATPKTGSPPQAAARSQNATGAASPPDPVP